MKKFLLSSLAGITMLFSADQAKSQALSQGDKAIDVYYGVFSISRSLINEGAINTRFFGPIGAQFEYLASDKMGVGVDFNYTSISWEEERTVTDSIAGTTKIYTDKVARTVIRFMPRFNIHFGSSESFDGYFGVAAGYRQATYKYTTDDPNYEDETIDGIIPFALRVCVGARYYFTDNIGANMEMGFGGGALINAGLSFKF